MAGVWNTTIYQGETWTREVSITDSAGEPIALSAPATMDIRRDAATTTRIARLSTTSGEIALASNTATLTLDATATAALPDGKWVYDLFSGGPDGATVALLAGSVTVVARVTKPEQS